MNKIIKQGVKSYLGFPVGQDEIAVSQAISQLLNEGWKFEELTKTFIRLVREWEVDVREERIGIINLKEKK